MRRIGGIPIPRAIGLGLAIVLVLNACGGGAGAPASPAGTTAAAATATSAAAAADAAWAKVVAAAKTEGSATIYTTEVPAWVDAVTALASQQTGLTMTLGLRGAGTVVEERLTADQRASAPVADVFSVIDRNFFLDHQDWFVNLKDAGLPNYAKYPAASTWKDLCADNKVSVGGLLYNNSLVAKDKVPSKWTDLTDPYWKGKIMMIDPRASASYMGWSIQMLKAYGVEYLQALAKQNLALNTSSAPAAEQVASGAYAVTFATFADSSSALRQKGAPVTFVVPQGPTIGSAACVGVLKNGPHPNAAKVLLNFLLSPEAQGGACKAGLELASPIGAAGCLAVPTGWAPTPVDQTTGVIFGTTDPALRQQVLDAFGIK